MSPESEERPEVENGAGAFVSTHWSAVAAAGHSDAQGAQEALEQLCRAYWYPLYAFVRRRGYVEDEAKDLTQDFFARLIEKNFLKQADRARGRFRCFLLGAMRHFLSNEWDRANAQKRGGGVEFVPWDEFTGEDRYRYEPAQPSASEDVFDRGWALTVVETVRNTLKNEYLSSGRGAVFAALEPVLTGDASAISCLDLSAQLGMKDGAIKVAVHRLRRRYGQLLRAEIARTVAGPQEVADELHHLFAALG